MKFALVMARKGSTRLPGKNKLVLAGRPLFQWSLLAALEADCFHRVFMSSDDDEILDIATAMDGVTASQRPAELAGGSVSGGEVLKDMISKVRAEDDRFHTFCMLQPTSPFRNGTHVAMAMDILANVDCDFVVGVREFDTPPHFALNSEKGLMPVHDGCLTRVTRTQDVPAYCHPAGGLYAGDADVFMRRGHFYGPRSTPLLLDHIAAFDINTLEDFRMAEILARGLCAESGA